MPLSPPAYAFLRRWEAQEGAALVRRSTDGDDEAFARRHADRSAEKTELADDDCHTAASDGGASGQDGLVEPGLLLRPQKSSA